MNYIEYLNQFWAMHREHYLTPCEAMVYFYILQRFNESRWKEQLPISMEQIVLGTGIHKVTARNARKRLADVGLIGYSTDKIGRGSCSLYRLKRVQLNGTILDHLIEKSGTKLDHFSEENGTILDHFPKEEISPIPPKEENNINNIYLASRESRDAHTRVSEMNSIEQLRMHFNQRMARESLQMNNKLTAEEYKMLCEEILTEWQISDGDEFPVNSDRKNHFMNKLRIKAEILRKQRGAGRTRQESKHELLTSALANLNNAINEIDKQPLISANEPV
jgi:hypothetical protein